MQHPLQPPVDYQHLFDNAPLGYLLLDASGSIERINQTGAALFAQDAEGMTGRPFADWVADTDREHFDQYLRRLRDSGRMEKLFVRVHNQQGEDLKVWLRGVASGDHPARLSLIDVSEEHDSARQQRYLQSQLAHLARRNMAGEFAASLAHELNQPLGTVVLSCDAALRFLREGRTDREGFSEALSQAREAALYASGVIGQLREFLKDGERDAQAARRTVPLDKVVDTVLTLIDANARDNGVALGLDIANAVPPVHVNVIQIGQVLVNLTHNSIEAMAGADNARLTIRARTDQDDRILVSVEDTGPGVDPAILDRLFNPFQTNKAGGMGMGLAISQNIIEAHGGELWAERPPAGALFCFTLPAAARGDHGH